MENWKIKDDSVKVEDLSKDILYAIEVTAEAYRRHGFKLVVTSAKDGKHMNGSKHYSGNAFDARIWGLKEAGILKSMLVEIRLELGDDFDAVLESDHYHIEYDPE